MKNNKSSIIGIDIIFISTSITFGIIVTIIDIYTRPFFYIKYLPLPVAISIGIVLLIIGIPFYILSAKTIYKIQKEGILCTTGVFAVCRHPLYSSWIFFLMPGIVVFFRSWLLLTIPLFMYIILVIFIDKEENYLLATYGDKYKDYKKSTNLSFPKIWKIFKKIN